MNLNLLDIRRTSLEQARKLGYRTNPALPLLDVENVRSPSQLADRILSLCAVLAVAYGLPRDRAKSWVQSEGVVLTLSNAERDLIMHGTRDPQDFQDQVNALFSLAWCAGVVETFRFDQETPTDLARRCPDVSSAEPATEFRRSLKPRSPRDVISKADLAYCIHWAIREAALGGSGAQGVLHPISVRERRRGLQWMISTQGWDEISLDT
jgi:hypothetical protein